MAPELFDKISTESATMRRKFADFMAQLVEAEGKERGNSAGLQLVETLFATWIVEFTRNEETAQELAAQMAVYVKRTISQYYKWEGEKEAMQ